MCKSVFEMEKKFVVADEQGLTVVRNKIKSIGTHQRKIETYFDINLDLLRNNQFLRFNGLEYQLKIQLDENTCLFREITNRQEIERALGLSQDILEKNFYKVLKDNGFSAIGIIKTEREIFLLNNTRVCLDKCVFTPNGKGELIKYFVIEVEIVTDNNSNTTLGANIEKINSVVSELGLDEFTETKKNKIEYFIESSLKRNYLTP